MQCRDQKAAKWRRPRLRDDILGAAQTMAEPVSVGGSAAIHVPIASQRSPELKLKRLLPAATTRLRDVAVSELLEEIASEPAEQKRRRGPRPRLLLNMASTADGRASIGGRSGPIGDELDSEILHGLRTVFDGLLIGAQTARAERYARIVRDDCERARRRARGLAKEPLACIISASLELSPENVPLLGEPSAKVLIITPSSRSLPQVPASVQYIRASSEGRLDLAAAMQELHETHGIATLLCEGGPTLAAELTASGLLDELLICLAPKLAGGREALRILAGAELQPPAALRLISLHEHDSELFLRYAVTR